MSQHVIPLPGAGGGSGEPYDDTEIRAAIDQVATPGTIMLTATAVDPTLQATIVFTGPTGPAFVVFGGDDADLVVARVQEVATTTGLTLVEDGYDLTLTGINANAAVRPQDSEIPNPIAALQIEVQPGAAPGLTQRLADAEQDLDSQDTRISDLEYVVIGNPPIPGAPSIPPHVTGTSIYAAPSEETQIDLNGLIIFIQPGSTIDDAIVAIMSVSGGQIAASGASGVITLTSWSGSPIQISGAAEIFGIEDGTYDNGIPGIAPVLGTGVADRLARQDNQISNFAVQLNYSLSVPASVSTTPIDVLLPVSGSIWINGTEVALVAGMDFQQIFDAFAAFANPADWYPESSNSVIHIRGVFFLSISAEPGVADALGLPTDFWQLSATVRDDLLAMEVKQADIERRLAELEAIVTAP